jgi:PAS domain S-box-containing protein
MPSVDSAIAADTKHQAASSMLMPLSGHRGVASLARTAPAAIRAGWARVARQIWVVGATLALLTLIGAGLTIWDMHRRTLQEANDDARTLGTVLAAQTTRYVEVIDLPLREVQAHSRELGLGTPDAFDRGLTGEATHWYLATQMKNLAQAHALSLIGADGKLLNTSRDLNPLPQVMVSDRDYFQHARDHADSGLFISVPAISRSSGVMSLFLSRRISGPDGGFLGVVVATVDVNYLVEFYEAISRERRFAVTLARTDGVVLARYPTNAGVGYQVPAASPWYARVAAGGGSYRSPGYLSGVPGIVSVTPLRDYLLVLDVVIHDSDVLVTWWRQAAYTAGGAVMLAGAFVVLFWLTARQLRRQARQNAELSRTADALRQTESRLRDFAELASDWFWEQDADLRFVSVDLGTPLPNLHNRSHLGKQRWEIIDTSLDPDRWDKHRQDLVARRPFRDFRFEQADASGAIHHISISGTPVRDRSGGFAGYRGIGRDITAQIEAEQELQQAKDRAEQAEALLQDAIDSIAEGFVIFDTEDRLVTCNEAYFQLFSAVADGLVPGVPFADIVRLAIARGVWPGAIGREAEWLEDSLRDHREASGEQERLRSDGRWLMSTNRRMRNGGIAGLRIDITPLKQAQAALRDSEARLDRAQEIADIGSWELDIASGKYAWSRHLYHIRGMPPEFQPTRENIAARINPDDFQMLSAWLADLQAGRARTPIEVRAPRPDGQERMLRVEARPVVDADGAIRRLAGTMQDITERRLIERQLAQAQKMEAIGNLTGGMAHDFNNVLGVIMGNLDLLQRLVMSDAAATELCGEALEGATRCAELIRRLLAFARRQSLRPQRVDVNELVSNIGRLLGRTLGKDIVLKLNLAASLWPVMADPAQLEAALVNLATNARDAMPNGGQLDVATRNVELDADYAELHPDVRPGLYSLIEITDTGTGIPPEIITRIFEPFFTTKESGKGTGLGLAMAFGFVKQSEGHLAVYSEPGLGTTFRLYLPRGEVSAALLVCAPDGGLDEGPDLGADGGADGGADLGNIAGGNEIVLVVEDDARLRLAAARQLAALGYQVREAEHAAAALAILARGDDVSLLFTDVVMPGTTDGIDLAHHATRLRQGLKVLLTSGFPGGRGVAQRMAGCPFAMLNKPYRRDELAQAVRDVLDRDAEPVATGITRPSAWALVDAHVGSDAAMAEQM